MKKRILKYLMFVLIGSFLLGASSCEDDSPCICPDPSDLCLPSFLENTNGATFDLIFSWLSESESHEFQLLKNGTVIYTEEITGTETSFSISEIDSADVFLAKVRAICSSKEGCKSGFTEYQFYYDNGGATIVNIPPAATLSTICETYADCAFLRFPSQLTGDDGTPIDLTQCLSGIYYQKGAICNCLNNTSNDINTCLNTLTKRVKTSGDPCP